MARPYSSLANICCLLAIIVLHSTLGGLASRKLLGYPGVPSPTPTTDVRYVGKQKPGASGEVTKVSGPPGTWTGIQGTTWAPNGQPVAQGTVQHGPDGTVINATVNGSPAAGIRVTNNSVTIYGPDGKPMFQSGNQPAGGYP